MMNLASRLRSLGSDAPAERQLRYHRAAQARNTLEQRGGGRVTPRQSLVCTRSQRRPRQTPVPYRATHRPIASRCHANAHRRLSRYKLFTCLLSSEPNTNTSQAAINSLSQEFNYQVFQLSLIKKNHPIQKFIDPYVAAITTLIHITQPIAPSNY